MQNIKKQNFLPFQNEDKVQIKLFLSTVTKAKQEVIAFINIVPNRDSKLVIKSVFIFIMMGGKLLKTVSSIRKF